MKDYIMEIPGAATPEFCDGMIEKFEADLRKRPGMIGPQGQVDREDKRLCQPRDEPVSRLETHRG